MEIKGQHFLITGSNRGIGRAVALMAASNGAYLHLANRTQDPELLQECRQAGAAEVVVYDLDLSSPQAIKNFLEKIKNQQIDILFNNAGQLTGGLLEEQSIDEIYAMMQVNLNAVIHLSQGVLPQMLARRKGLIINNSSVSGVMHLPCTSTYSAAKTAVVAFSSCLRNELVGTGVRVLVLLTPGIETRMFDEIPKKYGKNFDLGFLEASLTPKKYAQIIREAILEDLEELRPSGLTGIGLAMAQHTPGIFNKLIGKRFRR